MYFASPKRWTDMAISYRPYEPQQQMLLPASLQDWLPKGGAWLTSSATCWTNCHARYVVSSRKFLRRLHDDLVFRMLEAGNVPKHRAIRDSHALRREELSELFVQGVTISLLAASAMKHVLTIDSAGRIVLPSAERRALNLSAGSRLRLDVVAQRIERTPEPDADADGELLGRLGMGTLLKPTGQFFDAAEAVRAERDAQARRRG